MVGLGKGERRRGTEWTDGWRDVGGMGHWGGTEGLERDGGHGEQLSSPFLFNLVSLVSNNIKFRLRFCLHMLEIAN